MTLLAGAALVVACLGAGLGVTPAVRDFARRRSLHDRPNERSAHTVPTPRLGGLGIVPAALAAGALATALTPGAAGAWVVLAAAAGVSALGLLDDLRPLPARLRLLAQLGAAAAVVAACDDLGAAAGPFAGLPGWLQAVLAVLWITWLTNLYNFMDGIDGLAGAQAVLGGLGLAAAAFQVGAGLAGWWALFVAAGALGFLRYNRPPATIFMGDVGSTALGFLLASLPFLPGPAKVPVLAVGVALALFILDATVTLVRRIARRERLSQAHRSHFYQRPLALGVRHARITAVAAAGMAVCAGLAAGVPSAGPWGRAGLFAGAVGLFALLAGQVMRLERRGR